MDKTSKTSSSTAAAVTFYSKFTTGLNRALDPNTEWTDKDQFLDTIYWIRQVIGFVIGFSWGLLAFKGFVGILLFGIVNAFLIYLYTASYQKVDEDEFGGMWDILKEGFMTSFSTFLVFWIVVYTALHSH